MGGPIHQNTYEKFQCSMVRYTDRIRDIYLVYGMIHPSIRDIRVGQNLFDGER